MSLLQLASQQILLGIFELSIGFIAGTIFGWMLHKIMHKSDQEGKKFILVFVNIIIITLWSISVANSIFQFNSAQTPWFLHALMGGVMGYLNQGFGNYLFKITGRKIFPTSEEDEKL